jgi:hypothetical protein
MYNLSNINNDAIVGDIYFHIKNNNIVELEKIVIDEYLRLVNEFSITKFISPKLFIGQNLNLNKECVTLQFCIGSHHNSKMRFLDECMSFDIYDQMCQIDKSDKNIEYMVYENHEKTLYKYDDFVNADYIISFTVYDDHSEII